jgi:hypothetical protein
MQNLVKLQLESIGSALQDFLEGHLPTIGGATWWETHVLSQLTYAQQGQVRTRSITNLGGLDLAALLRVFDRNWAELSHAAKLPAEIRTYAKEITDMRHLHAHHSTGGPSLGPADAFRQLDTMERVLKSIGGDSEARHALAESKKQALATMAEGLIPKEAPVPQPASEISRPVIEHPQKKAEPAESADTATPIPAGQEISISQLQLIGPCEPIPTEIPSFDGRQVAASAVPWRIVGPKKLELLIHVVLIDDDNASGEFGQVFCESRLSSPEEWQEIVRRLRIGIRRLTSGLLTMDLRTAIRAKGERAAKRILPITEIDRLSGCDTRQLLLGLGARGVGKRQELTGETNRTREWPCVTFDANDLTTPAAAFAITTILPNL